MQKPNWLLIGGAGVVAFIVFFALGFVGTSRGGMGYILLLLLIVFGVLGSFIAFNLRNNRSVPMADDAARAAALSPPGPDEARLIVVREGFVGKMQGMDVTVDGNVVTQLKSPRFVAIPLSPGKHVVASKGQGMNPETIEIDVQPGTTALVRIAMNLGSVSVSQEPFDAAIQQRLATIPMVAA